MKRQIDNRGGLPGWVRTSLDAWRGTMKKPMPNGDRGVSSDELSQQAWAWLRLLSSRQVSEEDMQGFRRWVKSSAAHQAAYNDVKARWDTLKPLTGALLRANPGLVDDYKKRVQRRRAINRRTFLGLSVVTAVAAGVAAVYPPLGLWPSVTDWGADYRTAVGEQRVLALTEGVDVTLNTRTSVRRQMADGQIVGLDLLTGEAAVDLSSKGRSFVVIAGAGRSLAQAGQFEVRYVGSKVCVTCITGAVWVEHPAGIRTLQARQQVIYDLLAVSGIADINPAEVSAWRKGILVFRQVRLADVIDEINRYRPGRVILLNEAVRNQAVTGHFEIVSLDRAVTQLQYMFNLHARSLAGGLLLLS